MDPINCVGSAPAALVSQPSAASTSIVSSSSSVTQVTGSAGLGEGVAGLGGLGGSGSPADMMKLLVAMLLIDALLGEDKGGKDGKLGGALALSMLGQAASGGITMIDSSSTLMVSQQGATAAYGQTMSVSSMSVLG